MPRANECDGPQSIMLSGNSNFSSVSTAAVPVLLTLAVFVSLVLAGSFLRLEGSVTLSIRLDAEVFPQTVLGTRKRVSGCDGYKWRQKSASEARRRCRNNGFLAISTRVQYLLSREQEAVHERNAVDLASPGRMCGERVRVLERCRGADFHCVFSLCCTTVSLNSSASLRFRQD